MGTYPESVLPTQGCYDTYCLYYKGYPMSVWPTAVLRIPMRTYPEAALPSPEYYDIRAWLSLCLTLSLCPSTVCLSLSVWLFVFATSCIGIGIGLSLLLSLRRRHPQQCQAGKPADTVLKIAERPTEAEDQGPPPAFDHQPPHLVPAGGPVSLTGSPHDPAPQPINLKSLSLSIGLSVCLSVDRS